MGFFDDIASTWGGGNAKKAAKEQAKAIREQTQDQVRTAGYAAAAAANQQRNMQLTEAATEYAKSILGVPMETVSVRLAPEEQTASTDLRKRKRGIRDTYMTDTSQSRWFGDY